MKIDGRMAEARARRRVLGLSPEGRIDLARSQALGVHPDLKSAAWDFPPIEAALRYAPSNPTEVTV